MILNADIEEFLNKVKIGLNESKKQALRAIATLKQN